MCVVCVMCVWYVCECVCEICVCSMTFVCVQQWVHIAVINTVLSVLALLVHTCITLMVFQRAPGKSSYTVILGSSARHTCMHHYTHH